MTREEQLEQMLSDGLDLCVRARKMDAQERTDTQIAMSSAPKEWWTENLAARAAMHNDMFPEQPMSSRSATLAIWAIDQYEKDLADWERRARALLLHLAIKA